MIGCLGLVLRNLKVDIVVLDDIYGLDICIVQCVMCTSVMRKFTNESPLNGFDSCIASVPVSKTNSTYHTFHRLPGSQSSFIVGEKKLD